MMNNPYPPSDDYAFISDCHGTALVSRDGTIDARAAEQRAP